MIKVLCSGDESEMWLPVVGFPKYEVSSLGRVRAIASGIIKKPFTHRCRSYYPCVQLYVGYRDESRTGRRYSVFYVHKLVADAFLPSEDKLTVNHIDFDRWNNKVSNLERVSHAENIKHTALAGRYAIKCTPSQVIEIRKKHKEGRSIPSLAAEHNVSYGCVRDVVINKTYKWVK